MTSPESVESSSALSPIEQSLDLVTEVPGPRSQELMARRASAVSGGVGATHPLFVTRGGGGILEDVDGNRLIDLGSGIAVTTVGNSAPAVVQNVQQQVELLTHTCFMVTGYEPYLQVCEKLNELTPGGHEKKSALFNSGAEAVENAIKIARHYTGRSAVVAFEHGYHGRTNLTAGLTGKAMPFKKGFGPFAPEIYRVASSYPLRDGGRDGHTAAADAISRMQVEIGADQIAAIIIEPIQGEGGFIVPADGFLNDLAQFAKDNGIVFIADEVQSGFARTGTWFASEQFDLVPDLITTAKGIAGGLPLAGVTGRAEIMDAVHVGGLGGTYGGNPVACAAALGSIQTMVEQDLRQRAVELGELMVSQLQELADQTDVIAEVRGRGAMVAVEIVEPGTLTPDPALTKEILTRALSAGVVVLSAGSYGNVLRFLPPLVISDDLLHEGLNIVTGIVTELAGAR